MNTPRVSVGKRSPANVRKLLKSGLKIVPIVLALSLAPNIGWVHAATGTGDRGVATADKGNSLDKILKQRGKIPPSEQKAAAKRARALGMKPGASGVAAPAALPLPGIEGPGGVPHYFGPFANWAYSPLPKGAIATIAVVDGGTGYSAPVVTVSDIYGTSTNAVATATVTDGVITAISVDVAGSGYSAPIVTITDSTGTGATAAATIGGPFAGGLRKFVDKVPGLTAAGANGSWTVPPACCQGRYQTYSGSDYYEIALVQSPPRREMHSDLPATRMRGYVQVATSHAGAQHGGFPPLRRRPALLWTPPTTWGRPSWPRQQGRPRQVLQPASGARSNGAGRRSLPPGGRDRHGLRPRPGNPGNAGEKYTQNRADRPPPRQQHRLDQRRNAPPVDHPGGETTPYPQGVSVYNVPDMNPATVDSPHRRGDDPLLHQRDERPADVLPRPRLWASPA